MHVQLTLLNSAKLQMGCQTDGGYGHIAGLVAAGLHPNPVPHAHITTTTTHKTLRGPRGGLILTNDEELIKKINSAIFPGIQGGPLEHVIAKAVSFKEVLDPAFKDYAQKVIENSKAMAEVFLANPNFKVITGGTDNHLFLVDVTKVVENGKVAQHLLDEVNITLNKTQFLTKTLTIQNKRYPYWLCGNYCSRFWSRKLARLHN